MLDDLLEQVGALVADERSGAIRSMSR